MKRVIVTGSTGFIGANLTRRLLDDGHEVHLLIRRNDHRWRIEAIRDHVMLHEVDLRDRGTVAALIKNIRPDWVFHLAVHGAYSTQTDLFEMIETNIAGTMNLVQACLETGFEAFVNTGSSSEYGWKNVAASENTWLEPNSYYAATKASATILCRYLSQSQGVHIPTVRLYSVYGPFEEPTRLMPALILHGLRGALPPLVSPDIARDYVYIDDVNEAYLLAAGQPDQELGAVYNVGTGIQTSMREVVSIARQVMGVEALPEWGSMPDRHWDTNVWVADNQKIKNELSWQPMHTFEQGFRSMVDWFRNNKTFCDFYYDHF